jgi:hypothetical protein
VPGSAKLGHWPLTQKGVTQQPGPTRKEHSGRSEGLCVRYSGEVTPDIGQGRQNSLSAPSGPANVSHLFYFYFSMREECSFI